jgi:hypothetical protein
MVAANLNAERPNSVVRPLETYPPLLVDTDAELSLPVAAQRFKAIAGQEHQVVSADRSLQNIQALSAWSLNDSNSRMRSPAAKRSVRISRYLGESGSPEAAIRRYVKIDVPRQEGNRRLVRRDAGRNKPLPNDVIDSCYQLANLG